RQRSEVMVARVARLPGAGAPLLALHLRLPVATNSARQSLERALAGAGLFSFSDGVNYRWQSSRRREYLGYHTLCLFAVLVSSLPILLHVS
ncbi:DUF5924 family protein, partial [Pseudomonas aeruginosa]|uniref:DUF5924 family protein n=1 Tax=Pseudomonas aeruginosa TaxID=287 RepID=UPI003CC6D8D3